jgi:hypothetical protein
MAECRLAIFSLLNKRSVMMNKTEKYLEALEAAVEVRDKKAIELLDAFAAYVYHEIHAISNDASGEERAAWDGMLQRAKAVISGMSKSSPDIWD